MFLTFRRFAVSAAWMLLPTLSVAADAVPSTALLTITQAVDEAMAHSPRIAAAQAGVAAASGALEQAGALPNPTLGIEGENLAGSGNYHGINAAELTYGLTQHIELGGKRSAREAAAQHRQQMAVLDAAITRLDVERDVKQAFASAVSGQETLRLSQEALKIAGQEMKSVSRRVAEAASPLIQRSKAEVSLATAEFNVEQARQEEMVARSQLALLLGRTDIAETLDASTFFHVADPGVFESHAIDRTPDMLRLRSAEGQAASLLDVEKAASIPDPTVSLGVRELRDTNDRAFVLGLSIPIPVLNSNRGNIAQARAEVGRTTSDQHAARLSLLQRFAEAKGALRTAYIKATSYKATVLPAAEEAFKLSREGYGAGKFQYLEVLDAQRTLFDAKVQYAEALRDYHLRKAELERLTTAYTPAQKSDGDTHEKL